ncbi:hypothetical protein C8R43DRAFT_603798 [Mycena crocata]|nr:hypothetical protein C8R43DRAFT_603798 [Mycena crocata]
MLFVQIISRAVFFIPLIYYSTVPSARPPVSAFLLTFSESAARIGEDVWRAGGETRAILLALLPPARRAISIWANQATTRVLELATAFNLSRAQRSNNSLRSVPDLHAPSLQPVPRSAAHLFVYFYHLAEQSPASSLPALELSAVILSGERSAEQQLPVLTLPNHHPLESDSLGNDSATQAGPPWSVYLFFALLGFSLADGAGMPVVAPLTRIMVRYI